MATFFIAGLSTCERYAAAERIGDILSATMPAVTIKKQPQREAEWEPFLRNLRDVVGAVAPISPVVYTLEGRLVGTLEEFEQYCIDVYGIECDLSVHDLEAVVTSNTRASDAAHIAKQISAKGGRRALLVVSMAFDYCADGMVAVEGADDIILPINAVRRDAEWDAVVVTQHARPEGHVSFASSHDGKNPRDTLEDGTILWEDSCVAGTLGAEVHPYIDRGDADVLLLTQTGKDDADPSAFAEGAAAAAEGGEGLNATLKAGGITSVYVVGLAFDLEVRATALAAAKLGYDTYVVTDACMGHSIKRAESAKADMEAAGCTLLAVDQVPRTLAGRK